MGEERPETLAELGAVLRTLRSPVAEEGPPSYDPHQKVPAELRERLDALGYAR